jgi:flavin-dependent dehydrogenase
VQQDLRLRPGARVAVIGGGPAGSFFSIFLLETARKHGLEVQVDLYEPRDFTRQGPVGCNMCGGIISETLVHNMAKAGINMPASVVQQDIDSYVLHMDVGTVKIEAPHPDKQISAVYRGSGPRGNRMVEVHSFDGFLQGLAIEAGVNMIGQRVDEILVDASLQDGFPILKVQDELTPAYDLVAAAVGVNTAHRKLLKNLDIAYRPPQTTRTFIHEFFLGEETIAEYLGSAMHVFLLDIPRLEFAAVIPKGAYASICLLGENIDKALVDNFLHAPEVLECFPPGMDFDLVSCGCSPRINNGGAIHPFADRIVFIGDCGVTRLYKDGIGAAYRTAKSAAETAVLHGISGADFEKHYLPTCQEIEADNKVGRWLFFATQQAQRHRVARRALLRITDREQQEPKFHPDLSMVLWDMFTGSAPYTGILKRVTRPRFMVRYLKGLIASMVGKT